MKSYKTDPEYFETKAEILKALAHPARLCIVKGLIEFGESNVMNMQNCLQVPQSTISQHLSVLKSSGIIKGRREGLEIYYSVKNDVVRKIINMLFTSDDLINV